MNNNDEYFVKYFSIFYDNINSAITKRIDDDYFIKSFLAYHSHKFEEYDLKKETILYLFENLYSKIDDNKLDYDPADEIDSILLMSIYGIKTKKYKYTFEDFRNIFNIMNNKYQIYSRELVFPHFIFELMNNINNFTTEKLKSYENLYQAYNKFLNNNVYRI